MNSQRQPPSEAQKAARIANRKWHRDKPITSFDDLFRYIHERRYFFAERDTGYHWSFVGNWQVWRVRCLIQTGRLFVGMRNPNHPWVFEADWSQDYKDGKKSTYRVRCNDIPDSGFYCRSHAGVMRKARMLARRFSGDNYAKVEVSFNDWDRP